MDQLSSFQMYEKLLEEANLNEAMGASLNRYQNKWMDENDAEVFVTSKELVKATEQTGSRQVAFNEEPETIHYKRYTKKRVHKYTEQEMDAIKSSCYGTIVHDYGEHDWYHVSDEERMRRDELAELSLKLAKLKRTYRRVDQYIEAMRVVYEAWETLAKMNFVHTKKEFFSMVAKGHIVSNRIIMPKLKRLDQYNIDMIVGYISNPSIDVSHLAPQPAADQYFMSDEDEEAEMNRLLSKDEIEYICEYDEAPEQIDVIPFKSKYIAGYSERKLRRRKKESKDDFKLRQSISSMLKKIESNSHFKEFGRSYMITHTVFEPTEEKDTFWDELRFNGSWANDNDVFLYDMVVNERMMDQKPPNERYLTYGDKELEKFFNTLEEQGVSTIELRRRMSNPDAAKITEKEVKKEGKKLEANILARITKLNNSVKFKKIASKAEESLMRYREDE